MRRRRIVVAAVLAALALGAAAVPAPAPKPTEPPVYVAGSQYSAVLDQQTRHWRLLPLDGQDLILANPDVYCRADAAIPNGVWLVATDPAGGIELRATSAVLLPTRHPPRTARYASRVPGATIARPAPRALIDMLAGNTGAVYVHD